MDELKAVFDSHRQEWLRAGHSGEWAVVTRSGSLGFFERYQDAFIKAETEAPGRRYLLQQVLPEDRIETILHVAT